MDNLRWVKLMRFREEHTCLHTAAKGCCTPLPSSGPSPLVVEAVVLERMSVDDQRAPTDTTALEIVACVTNYQSDIVLAGKVHTSFDILFGLSHDNVNGIVAKSAWRIGIARRAARVVCEKSPHVGGGLIDTVVKGKPPVSAADNGTRNTIHTAIVQLQNFHR
jgi:hypothetical protein